MCVTFGIEEMWERDKSRYGDMCPRRECFVWQRKKREQQWVGERATREKLMTCMRRGSCNSDFFRFKNFGTASAPPPVNALQQRSNHHDGVPRTCMRVASCWLTSPYPPRILLSGWRGASRLRSLRPPGDASRWRHFPRRGVRCASG